MGEFLKKLRELRRRDEILDELREEMETHLEMKSRGLGDHRAARVQFGNTTRIAEEARSVRGWPWLDAMVRDIRYALRSMVRQPAFVATLMLTLALGIGTSSTFYSLVDAILIQPLLFPDSERLIALHEEKTGEQHARTRVAPGRLEDWRSRIRLLESIAGSHVDTLTEAGGEVPELLRTALVSPGFFQTLRVAPALGRSFTLQEEHFGGPQAALISHGLWQRRFGGKHNAIGGALTFSGQRYWITGVMPEWFRYPDAAVEVWIPKQAPPSLLQTREARLYAAIGRLRPGANLDQARAELHTLQQRLANQYPKTDAGWSVSLEPLKDNMVGGSSRALWLVFLSSGLLLLIACANAACLLLARLTSRAAELATRTSLGARSSDLVRQVMIEGAIYSLAGGALGLFVAAAGIDFVKQQLPTLPRINELSMEPRVIGIVLGISLATAVLSSLGPAIQVVRGDLSVMMKTGSERVAGGRQGFTRVLVTSQIALATALVICSSLLIRSLVQLEESPLGFRHQQVLSVHVGANVNETPAAVVERQQRILAALRSTPGVENVALSTGLPAVQPAWPREFTIEGEETADGSLRFASWRIVTAGYFEAVGIPISAGRSCRMGTGPGADFEVLVNRSFARRHLGGRDPIGRMVAGGPQGEAASRIVGVVEDAREDGGHIPAPMMIYACGYPLYWPDPDILVRSSDPAAIAPSVRSVLRSIEPTRPIYGLRTLSEALEESLSATRFRTWLVAAFSLVALSLASIGLYGMMAYAVAQRRREIGIRIAMGARPEQILGRVLRTGGVLALTGTALGVLIAWGAGQMMATLLYGVRPNDGVSYLLGAAVLGAVSLVACLIPGKRATRTDAVRVLRMQ